MTDIDERVLEMMRETEQALRVNVKVTHDEVSRLVVADLIMKYRHNCTLNTHEAEEWARKFHDVLEYYLNDDEIEIYCCMQPV